jgi:hypothetical protein
MLDSLVRVSRRVEPHPIVSFSEWIRPKSRLVAPLTTPPSLPLRSSADYNKWARKLTSPFYTGPEQKQSKLTSRKERSWSGTPELTNCGLTTQKTNQTHHIQGFLPSRLVWLASLCALSSTLSLSFQSSFHLSLTVLVRYRSLAYI